MVLLVVVLALMAFGLRAAGRETAGTLLGAFAVALGALWVLRILLAGLSVLLSAIAVVVLAVVVVVAIAKLLGPRRDRLH